MSSLYQPQYRELKGTSPKYLEIENLGTGFYFPIQIETCNPFDGNALSLARSLSLSPMDDVAKYRNRVWTLYLVICLHVLPYEHYYYPRIASWPIVHSEEVNWINKVSPCGNKGYRESKNWVLYINPHIENWKGHPLNI